ncbi:MAG TPA: F0F1 ATP synthase subunit alpha [Candidatus Paceibacterota bacterium]|nr:F0F1 ATP synthase subunit alpha [Candidatus Paceibacterota bacterium]
MSYDIIEKLKKEIAGHKSKDEWQDVGRVLEVGDGIVKLQGLPKTVSQELLIIHTEGGDRQAMALNLEEETIGALVLDDYLSIKSGDRVVGTGKVLSIPVGPELIGRVLNPLGQALDGKGDPFEKKAAAANYNLENKAPSVLDRQPVNTPLHTGIKTVDSMIPIGRGQRELIIGDRGTGKTAIAIDTIINQKGANTICIYVAVGQKESKVARIVETLKQKGAMEYTIIVLAGASSPAAMWYLAPLAGAAIGEYFRDQGKDALVIFDDLSKHAWAYRQISLLLRRPPGREAYPGDVFFLHSRLLERASKLSKEKGGGSLTALPIIETQLGDVTAYIPTNVISITDGQIYLESDLFNQGIRPAMNVGLSVSRVGSAAQTKAMKKVAGKLRLQLAQFRELQAFVQFASDVDETTKQRIRQGQIITEILKQDDLAPLPFEQQVAVFYATLNGYFNNVAVAEVKTTETKFMEHLSQLHGEILETIRTSRELSAETEEKLKKAIESFFAA